MTFDCTTEIGYPTSFAVAEAVREALKEDLGSAGDITTNSVVPENIQAEAVISARQPGIIAGLQFVTSAFTELDSQAQIQIEKPDGSHAGPGDTVAKINCNARALLTGERVALNYLSHLSGIATLTGSFVNAVADTNARICCTRKTTPLLRSFEKYAVRIGGAVNHRFGLNDAVLIKDNHIALAGGIEKAIEKTLAGTGHMVKIEVEVDTLAQLDKALNYPIDAVLLDNMTIDQLKDAVHRIDGKLISEASGSVSLETVRDIALTGVDLISVGKLTHSAPVLDLGLDFDTSNS